jgi:shikimate kinase
VVKSTSENALQNNAKKNDRLKKRSGKTVDARKRDGVRGTPSSAQLGAAAGNIVFLVGFMGAGKTSVGRALGQRLNWSFEDLDDRIERHAGRTIAEIFRDSGEAAFRQAEHLALRQVLEESASGVARIVAMGGGAFVQRRNAALLNAAGVPTVFLNASVEELWQRCIKQAGKAASERPLLKSREQFGQLYEIRRTSYSKSSLTIETGGRTVDAIATEIAQKLGLKEIRTRTEQGEAE